MKFNLPINDTLRKFLDQVDTDGGKKITVDDKGPKRFLLEDNEGNVAVIIGTYQLFNLLQELALAAKKQSEFAEISLSRITELPVDRISRKIKDYYWDGLARSIDEAGIRKIIEDDKIDNTAAYLYVPATDPFSYDYFKKLEITTHKLEVVRLPEEISADYVLSINKKPGILALALKEGNAEIKGVPFVVPGG